MVPDHVLFDSLEKAAENRRKLVNLIEQLICVSALRLHMEVSEIRALTGYSRSKIVGTIDRADPSASMPSRDPDAGRARVARELPELVELHGKADALVHQLARMGVIQRKMSANELARRTGHSRDFTQKWVKRIRAEGLDAEVIQITRSAQGSGWRTPQWGEGEPVDPKYIVTAESREEAPTTMGSVSEPFRCCEARRIA